MAVISPFFMAFMKKKYRFVVFLAKLILYL